MLFYFCKKIKFVWFLQVVILINPGISKQMLTAKLRELELDGLITRQIYAEIPPRVEYFMTEKGKTLIPILIQVEAWGRMEMQEKSPIPLK